MSGTTGKSKLVLATFSVLVGAPLVMLLAALTAIREAKGTELRAEVFMREFLELRVGRSTLADAERLAEKYDGYRDEIRNRPPDCVPECTDFSFWFENRWSHRITLAPHVVLWATMRVSRGHLLGRGLSFGCERPYAQVNVDEMSVAPSGKAYEARRQKFVIVLTPQASAEQRQRAFAVNLKRLSKLGPCEGEEELLPGVWPASDFGD